MGECLHSSITLRVANLGQGWVEMGMDRNSYREMTKPLLAILLLLPLSVSAGELDYEEGIAKQ